LAKKTNNEAPDYATFRRRQELCKILKSTANWELNELH